MTPDGVRVLGVNIGHWVKPMGVTGVRGVSPGGKTEDGCVCGGDEMVVSISTIPLMEKAFPALTRTVRRSGVRLTCPRYRYDTRSSRVSPSIPSKIRTECWS